MMPYDGSLGSNALGMMIEEDERRADEAMQSEGQGLIELPETPFGLFVFLAAVGTFLFFCWN